MIHTVPLINENKMAEHNSWCFSKRVQKNSNSDYYSRVNCPTCSEFEYLLKEANVQLSSLQYINKLLYKELNHGETTSIESEWSRTAPWAQLSTSNWNQNNYPGNSTTQLTPQPIRTTNTFSILAEQHDAAVEHEANPRDSKGTRNRLTPYHTYKGKQPQNKISARNNTNNHRGRTSSQHPNDCQTPRNEQRNQVNCDKEYNLISKNHRLNPLVSSNTNTTVSVMVSPTDKNTTHPNLSEWWSEWNNKQ
jgi:hypothetical protein